MKLYLKMCFSKITSPFYDTDKLVLHLNITVLLRSSMRLLLVNDLRLVGYFRVYFKHTKYYLQVHLKKKLQKSELNLNLIKYSGPTSADDMTLKIIMDCGNLNAGLCTSTLDSVSLFLQTLAP